MTARRNADTAKFALKVLAILACGLALGMVALWIIPPILTRHPSADMTSTERLKAVNDARAPVVAFLVASGAAGTLWFTARSYVLNREGNVTDRYTKAIDQLGSASLDVCIGGIHALERIAQDSRRDRMSIVNVLAAFVRRRSKDARPPTNEPSEAIKAAIGALSAVLPLCDAKADLRGADLSNVDLSGLDRAKVNLPPGQF